MLWLRGLLFTLLIPGFISVYVPRRIIDSRVPQEGWWQLGWLPVTIGSAIYFRCLFSFFAADGTPAIFFTRHLQFLIGREPSVLVRSGLYKLSRNPMYLGVVIVIAGQAILYSSGLLTAYAAAVFFLFHLVVVFIEEPHLKARDPNLFEQYRQEAPRWLGFRKQRSVLH